MQVLNLKTKKLIQRPLVYYQNVRGLRTKLIDLRMAQSVSSVIYDVIIVVETWLNDGIADSRGAGL